MAFASAILITKQEPAVEKGAHPMISDITPRLYQEMILNTCATANTLVVLPTGLGKTLIAMMLSAQRLALYPDGKVLVLAPTKPLVEQHMQTFQRHLSPDAGSHVLFTGDVGPEKRAEIWKQARFIYATPQSLENDLLSNRISLTEVSLVVFDEAHHAVGDYSYVYLSKRYNETAMHPRVLGLTASPGANIEHILEVCKNLEISQIESRSADDPDVALYIQETEIKWVHVELGPEMIEVKKCLDECFNSKMSEIHKLGLLKYPNPTKTELIKAQSEIHGMIMRGERDFEVLRSASLLAEALKVSHAQELLETQGLDGLGKYFRKIDEEAYRTKIKAVKNLVRDANWRMAFIKTSRLIEQGVRHPKMLECVSLVKERLQENTGGKAIVFTQFRDTAREIVGEINKQDGLKAQIFVGQTKKGDTGTSRKEQAATIQRFREGQFNVMVATSVAEEGLDIPSVNFVVFYEPIPSAIRSIQRRGRTGRQEQGEVYMLVTKGTRDEMNRWSAHHKEKKMHKVIADLKKQLWLRVYENSGQKTIREENGPLIRVDPREKGSGVMKALISKGVQLELRRLESGDYQLSPRVLVEYKTNEDFIESIIDGRLFSQARQMKTQAVRPLIIVEGERDIYSVRQIHPNAVNGAITSLAVSFNIPVIFTRTSLETAETLLSIAKKEADYSLKRFSGQQIKKPATPKEQQEFFLSSMPGVSSALAKSLLEHFGTPARVFSASAEELKEVSMVGEKKAKEIHSVLHEPYPRGDRGSNEQKA